MRPCRASAAVVHSVMLSSSVTSTRCQWTRSPSSRVMAAPVAAAAASSTSVISTHASSRAKALAVADPIPLPAPVMQPGAWASLDNIHLAGSLLSRVLNTARIRDPIGAIVALMLHEGADPTGHQDPALRPVDGAVTGIASWLSWLSWLTDHACFRIHQLAQYAGITCPRNTSNNVKCRMRSTSNCVTDHDPT